MGPLIFQVTSKKHYTYGFLSMVKSLKYFCSLALHQADLFEFVKNVFKCTGLDSEIEKGKLVGMGSDGASNMLGCKAGLVTLMKNDYPELIGIHCLCHRLELSFRDVLKNNTYYKKMMTLLIGLNYFYARHKQKQGLRKALDILDIAGLLPPRVTGTHWLSHVVSSLRSLFRNYRVYEAHLGTLKHSKDIVPR